MRAVVQRVSRAEVRIDGEVVGRVERGLLILVGIASGDTAETGKALAEKIANLRIFDDEQGRMNRSLLESGGGALCVSQFTLYGDCRKGRRPSFDDAAPAGQARALYESFVAAVRRLGVQVETGVFQAHMAVTLTNDGPVTLIVESPATSIPSGSAG